MTLASKKSKKRILGGKAMKKPMGGWWTERQPGGAIRIRTPELYYMWWISSPCPNSYPSTLWDHWKVLCRVIWFNLCFKLITLLLYGSDPQHFWHQGPISWKTIFPWTGVEEVVSEWFKCIIFIVHFIFNIILLLICWEVPVHGPRVGETNVWDMAWREK